MRNVNFRLLVVCLLAGGALGCQEVTNSAPAEPEEAVPAPMDPAEAKEMLDRLTTTEKGTPRPGVLTRVECSTGYPLITMDDDHTLVVSRSDRRGGKLVDKVHCATSVEFNFAEPVLNVFCPAAGSPPGRR